MPSCTETVLITGASGFAGKLLAEAELKRGRKVIGIYHPSESPDLNFPSYPVDLNDSEKVSTFIKKVEDDQGNSLQGVYHLAAMSSVRMCQENPKQCYDVNVTGTLNLLDSVSRLGSKPKFLFTSSAEVYGRVDEKNQPLTENMPPKPVNIYGMSKLTAENLCKYYWAEQRLPTVVVRSFNHTGPGQKHRFVFPHVARTLARIEKGLEEPVLKMGNLSVRRDFADVRDIVQAYMKVIDKADPGEVYNVTSGRCISIEEGVRLIVEISEISVNILQESLRMRSYDIPKLSGDASQIAHDLDWRTVITLEQTMKDLLDYWRVKEGVI